jgi:hypothetical protein
MRLRSHRSLFALAALAALTATLSPWTAAAARACPFCTAQALTLTEEIDTAEVAVIATLVKVPNNNQQPIDPSASLEPCEFKIDKVIKGKGNSSTASLINDDKVVKTLYLGQAAKGTKFLLTAVPGDQSNIIWAAPIALPERGPEYLDKVLELPKEGPQRLIFFQDYIQDQDDLLARDAYDEIARTAYGDIVKAKDKLRHDDFVKWIQDPDTTASKRRMFFSLLSVCGTKEDVPMLEKMIRSTDRRDRSGLDSMLNCYMALLGEDAMPLIEKMFLKDAKVDYTDRYSAIMAIRFQGTEGNAVPRERLIQALRLNLDHPKVADLVVMDLARWKDWDVMERLVEMFEKSTDETIFIREPVINYLRICPRPEAKKHLAGLAKLDPIAYQRALAMMQLPATPAQDDKPNASGQKSAAAENGDAKKDGATAAGDTAKPDVKPKADAAAPPATPPVKRRSDASSPQLRSRTAKRPQVAVTGVNDNESKVTRTDDSATDTVSRTGTPGTITVAAIVLAAAITGAAVSLRK